VELRMIDHKSKVVREVMFDLKLKIKHKCLKYFFISIIFDSRKKSRKILILKTWKKEKEDKLRQK
jgi:hypothetical protein